MGRAARRSAAPAASPRAAAARSRSGAARPAPPPRAPGRCCSRSGKGRTPGPLGPLTGRGETPTPVPAGEGGRRPEAESRDLFDLDPEAGQAALEGSCTTVGTIIKNENEDENEDEDEDEDGREGGKQPAEFLASQKFIRGPVPAGSERHVPARPPDPASPAPVGFREPAPPAP
ncbi:hypothetical protein ACGFWE_42990 [Streptomyces sp. NPDC048523]|uniref:hypothetical protein n=1 Tax=Streptomyces sp. NPDC048523 TaxID=3365567 RepID=UPI0037118196